MKRNLENKLFKQEIKRLNKEHTPEKFDRRERYNWKKEWGPFVKYQGDWDHSYFLDLIIYKLERIYSELEIFSSENKKDLNKRLATLKDIIALGKKLQTYDYEKEQYDFLKQHTTKYVLIYEGKHIFGQEPKLLNKVLEAEHSYLDDLLGKKEADKWCEENGYKEYKDCYYAYTSEWDSEDNYKVWLGLIKKNNKEKQNDTDKFFRRISRNYEGWWH